MKKNLVIKSAPVLMVGDDTGDHTSADPLTVETIDNHIYFYSRVNSDRCLSLIRSLRELDNRLRTERQTRQLPEGFPAVPIWLHIYSPGGDLHAGLATADQIPRIQTPIYSVIEGYCASAATLISLACRRRHITPSGFMLLHQFSSMMWGTHEEFKDEMTLQEMLIKLLIEFYADTTSLSAERIREILKRDSWFSAAQCLEMGLVDEIIGSA